MTNMMNFLFPLLISKQELAKEGITTIPSTLFLGAFLGSGVPLAHQLIMNKQIVGAEIAKQNELEIEQKFAALKSNIAEVTTKLYSTNPSKEIIIFINGLRKLAELPQIEAVVSSPKG